MTIFYTPDITQTPILPEEESRHAVRVLRLTVGNRVQLIDGCGGLYEAEIINPHPKHCEVKIIGQTHEYGRRNYRLHIAIAPTKNIERLEWFVEKATEIGIDEITPIICRHSERREVKTARLEKVIIAAAKQSGKAYIPKLNDAQPFAKFISDRNEEQKMIAYCNDEQRILLQNIAQKQKTVLILIGPEGDFSEEEVAVAIKNSFVPVSLGESRLRTETAGVVACHTVSLLNNF